MSTEEFVFTIKRGLLAVFAIFLGCSSGVEYLSDRNALSVSPSIPVLGPGDVFVVRVFREPDLSGEYEVGRDGMIDFPLVGRIKVAGKTTDQIAKEIKQTLAQRYLKDPFVSVVVKRFTSKRVYVLGEVAKPGILTYQEGMSVIQAIAEAGGFKKTASRNHVIVTRQTPKGEKRIEVPVERITEGKAPNFLLAPGDIVYVPESLL